ncbi:hypothetical protein OpiT1DRAFT_05420 [Opitutaceae bacterium TAV1]|nr:hypothetical protein OpiT1DRAFT_05420 [Opitutaceae bacterium TAV1]
MTFARPVPLSPASFRPMATDVEICNQALVRVGENVVTSLDDDTEASRRCLIAYAPTVREVLRDGQWHCATHRAVLAPLAQKPAFGWERQFLLPADFIRTISLNEADVSDPASDCPLFSVAGPVLLSNVDEARIVYVRDLLQAPAQDPATAPTMERIDPVLESAIVLKLASKLAWAFQQSRILSESLLAEYGEQLKRAWNINSRDAWGRAPGQLSGTQSAWLAHRR